MVKKNKYTIFQKFHNHQITVYRNCAMWFRTPVLNCDSALKLEGLHEYIGMDK